MFCSFLQAVCRANQMGKLLHQLGMTWQSLVEGQWRFPRGGGHQRDLVDILILVVPSPHAHVNWIEFEE